ncbi:hypothetical protein D3C72_2078930 [compost metagenome]
MPRVHVDFATVHRQHLLHFIIGEAELLDEILDIESALGRALTQSRRLLSRQAVHVAGNAVEGCRNGLRIEDMGRQHIRWRRQGQHVGFHRRLGPQGNCRETGRISARIAPQARNGPDHRGFPTL